MKLFIVLPLFLVGTSVFTKAMPQDVSQRYGPQSGNPQAQRRPNRPRAPAPNPGPGCRIEYTTKFEVVHEESVKRECKQWTENKCTTKTRPRCTPYVDKVCSTKYKQQCRNWTDKECEDTWRQDCNTRTKEECNEYQRPKEVAYTEDDCVTKTERRCDQHWEVAGPGKKVWVDNPNTCQDYSTTDCKPVQKYRTVNEKYTKCDQVPYQHCDRVKDTNCYDVPKQECNDEPYQDCHDVQKEDCVNESWQDCKDYPREKCEDVHRKVPNQVAVQVPVRVCDHSGNGNFDSTSVFDIRTASENQETTESEEDVEEFDDPEKENIDPGFFSQVQTKLPTATKNAEKDEEVAFVFGV